EYINRVDVVVERGDEVARVADAIAAVLPAGLRVEAPFQRKADLHKVMHSLQLFLQGVGSLGVVAGFLIAFNRLATLFELRAWEPRCWRRRFRPAAWPRLAWRRRSAAAAWSSRG